MRVIVILILLYLIYRLTKSFYPHMKRGFKEGMGKTDSSILDEMVKDPSCQVYLPKKQAISEKIGSEWHYFCSEECRKKYKEQVKG
jgi:YHS domain-containing protein